MRLVALLAMTALAVSPACMATTLDQQTSGTNPNASGYFGQFFQVAGAGTYTDIRFSFYAYPGTTTTYALGTGYLFSQPYGGAPGGLGPSDVNFLGSAQASGGAYSFGSSVTLSAGQNYYFYEDAALPASAISGQGAAEEFFYAANASSNFVTYQGRSNNYLVIGDATTTAGGSTVTPEPANLLLVGTGVLALWGIGDLRSRSRRRASFRVDV